MRCLKQRVWSIRAVWNSAYRAYALFHTARILSSHLLATICAVSNSAYGEYALFQIALMKYSEYALYQTARIVNMRCIKQRVWWIRAVSNSAYEAYALFETAHIHHMRCLKQRVWLSKIHRKHTRCSKQRIFTIRAVWNSAYGSYALFETAHIHHTRCFKQRVWYFDKIVKFNNVSDNQFSKFLKKPFWINQKGPRAK